MITTITITVPDAAGHALPQNTGGTDYVYRISIFARLDRPMAKAFTQYMLRTDPRIRNYRQALNALPLSDYRTSLEHRDQYNPEERDLAKNNRQSFRQFTKEMIRFEGMASFITEYLPDAHA